MIIAVVCKKEEKGILAAAIAAVIRSNKEVFQPEPKNGGKRRRISLAVFDDCNGSNPLVIEDVLPGDNGGLREPMVALCDIALPADVRSQMPEDIRQRIPVKP